VQATREITAGFIQKMCETFSVVKQKAHVNTNFYRHQLEKVSRSEAKVEELQKHFDRSVIPQVFSSTLS
jgi:hypothetical protein